MPEEPCITETIVRPYNRGGCVATTVTLDETIIQPQGAVTPRHKLPGKSGIKGVANS